MALNVVGFQLSGAIVIMLVLGGTGRLYGAFVGAFFGGAGAGGLAFGGDQDADFVAGSGFLDEDGGAAEFDVVTLDGERPHLLDVVHREPVLEAMHTAGIFRDVAADGARNLARWIGRVIETLGRDGFADRQVCHTRLRDDNAIGVIDLEDAIELRHAQQHAVGRDHAQWQLGPVVGQPADLGQVGVRERKRDAHHQAHGGRSGGAPPPRDVPQSKARHLKQMPAQGCAQSSPGGAMIAVDPMPTRARSVASRRRRTI